MPVEMNLLIWYRYPIILGDTGLVQDPVSREYGAGHAQISAPRQNWHQAQGDAISSNIYFISVLGVQNYWIRIQHFKWIRIWIRIQSGSRDF